MESKLTIPRPIPDFQTILSRDSFEASATNLPISCVFFHPTFRSNSIFVFTLFFVDRQLSLRYMRMEHAFPRQVRSRSLDFSIPIVAMPPPYVLRGILDKIFFLSSVTRVPSLPVRDRSRLAGGTSFRQLIRGRGGRNFRMSRKGRK